MSRPSLKITRHDDRDAPDDISFEVWNPLDAVYEPVDSVKDGLQRVAALATTIHEMWVAQDVALGGLSDTPEAAAGDDSEWAECRIGAQANRVVETRRFDKAHWVKAKGNLEQAALASCNEVGYVPA